MKENVFARVSLVLHRVHVARALPVRISRTSAQ